MQEKDAVTNEYFKSAERVADIMNVFIFEGQPVIAAEDVQDQGESISKIIQENGALKANTVILDVVKKVCKGILVTMIHLQNQTDIHYAMPVRVMNEEAAYYYREWKRSADHHKRSRDLKGAEYTSGFAKGEKLTSASTIVVYWGQKAWDGPKRLKDMLNVDDYPLELQRFIVDYPIHLLEVRQFENLGDFKTDIKYVFGFLQRDRDKEALAEYVQKNGEIFSNLPEGTYNVISKMSHCRELKKIKNKVKREENYNMCQAISEMIEDGRREGSANMLLIALKRFGKIPEDLHNIVYQQKNLRVLEAWFQKALIAESMEEFWESLKEEEGIPKK